MPSLYPARSTPEEIAFVCDTIRELGPNKTIVEIGCWEGGLTVEAATTAMALCSRYAVVDWFEGSHDLVPDGGVEGALRRFEMNMKANELDQYVNVFVSESAAGADNFLEVDLAYIDADHRYPAVVADIAAWWPVVKSGGFLAGHDFCLGSPGVIRAVTEFAIREKLPVEFGGSRFPVWRIRKP